jgi:hypothetical protein
LCKGGHYAPVLPLKLVHTANYGVFSQPFVLLQIETPHTLRRLAIDRRRSTSFQHLCLDVVPECVHITFTSSFSLDNLYMSENYHSATSPAAGFTTRTILSQFNKHSGSNACFICNGHNRQHNHFHED